MIGYRAQAPVVVVCKARAMIVLILSSKRIVRDVAVHKQTRLEEQVKYLQVVQRTRTTSVPLAQLCDTMLLLSLPPMGAGKADQRGDSRQGPTIHQGVSCDVCGTDPIVGVRYKSYSTPDFDVCSSCYKSEAAQQHAPFHETGSLGRGTASSPNLSERPGPAGAAAAAGGASAGPSRVQDSSGSCQNGSSSTNNDKGRNKRKQPGADDRRSAVSRHQALAEWIWAYFSTPGFQGVQDQQQIGPQGAAAAASQRGINSRVQGSSCSASTPVNAFERLQQRPTAVVMTGKPPLYFQHEGHSRTIVGIERTLAPGAQQQPAAQGTQGGAAEYTLIVLDPGMPQAELLNSLR